MAEVEGRLRAAGGIPAFKRAVAERLADYPVDVRGPLTPPARAAAGR
jgi:hypothetical protein